jgi:drug/metabolite transporter (DMT)-like permease
MSTPRRATLFLILGLAAASQSGNIIRLADAHPVALAAWRLMIASALLAPLAGKDLKLLFRLSRNDALLLILAGITLAAHFFAWIAAVQHTTVANAAVFFSINPVFTATASFLFFKERAGPKLMLSIAVGISGVAVLGGGDLSFNREHLDGDLLALLCSVLFTVYFLLGKRLRRQLPTGTYVSAVYGVAAVAAFACLFALQLPLFDYSSTTWLSFLLLAVGPTMLGHTSMNHALRYIPAGKISTATLSEPLLAGLVAFLAWGESVTVQTAAGYVLISASVVVLASDWKVKRTSR